jgi:hypothetical protein
MAGSLVVDFASTGVAPPPPFTLPDTPLRMDPRNRTDGSGDVFSFKASPDATTRIEDLKWLEAEQTIPTSTRRDPDLAQPTQAYLAAQRLPYVKRVREALVVASECEDVTKMRSHLGIARESLAHVWQYVDLRDDRVAQYLALVSSALETPTTSQSRAKLRSLIEVVDAVLQRKFDAASRRAARVNLIRRGAFAMPELTVEDALVFEREGDDEPEDEEPAS